MAFCIKKRHETKTTVSPTVNSRLPYHQLFICQDSTYACKIAAKELDGTYVGECKKGWAHGKGEAKGSHHYIGNFNPDFAVEILLRLPTAAQERLSEHFLTSK